MVFESDKELLRKYKKRVGIKAKDFKKKVDYKTSFEDEDKGTRY